MESHSWSNGLSTASSRRYHQSRSDLFIGEGYDQTDSDGELGAMFLCPFCAEDFDIVGLCCHIDEDHPHEAKNGACPVCAKRVGMDMVSHITKHGNFYKISFCSVAGLALVIYLCFEFVVPCHGSPARGSLIMLIYTCLVQLLFCFNKETRFLRELEPFSPACDFRIMHS